MQLTQDPLINRQSRNRQGLSISSLHRLEEAAAIVYVLFPVASATTPPPSGARLTIYALQQDDKRKQPQMGKQARCSHDDGRATKAFDPQRRGPGMV